MHLLMENGTTVDRPDFLSPSSTIILLYLAIILVLALVPVLVVILIRRSTCFQNNPILLILSVLLGDSLPAILQRYGRLQSGQLWSTTGDSKRKKKLSSKISKTSSLSIEIYRPTVQLTVYNTTTEQSESVRALLDTGSAYSYITPDLVRRLAARTRLIWPLVVHRFPGLPASVYYRTVVGVALRPVGDSIVTSNNSLQMLIEEEAEAEQNRNCRGPSAELRQRLERLGIKLSDDSTRNNSSSYDLLLGQDLLHSHVLGDYFKTHKLTKELSILETEFGAAIIGRFDPKVNFEVFEARTTATTRIPVFTNPLQSLILQNPLWKSVLALLPTVIIFINLSLSLVLLGPTFLALVLVNKVLARPLSTLLAAYFTLISLAVELFFSHIKPNWIQLIRGPIKYSPETVPHSYQPMLTIKVTNAEDITKSVDEVAVLLDTGARYSYISSVVASRLGCPVMIFGERKAIWVRLTGRDGCEAANQKVLLWIHPAEQFKRCPNASRYFNPDDQNSNLHPTHFNIILGADLLTSVFTRSTYHRLGSSNLAILQTAFGATIQGANANLQNSSWNVLQNSEVFNFIEQHHQANSWIWFWCLALGLLWLDALPMYLVCGSSARGSKNI